MRPRAASLNAAATVATSAARVVHRASGDDNLCCCSARRWCATADPVYTVTTHWPRRRSGLSVHTLCVDHCASESIDRRAPLITEWNGPTRCGTVHTVVCCRIRSLPRLGLQSLHNVCETHVSLTHGRHCALHSSAHLTKETLSGRAGSVGRTVEGRALWESLRRLRCHSQIVPFTAVVSTLYLVVHECVQRLVTRDTRHAA